MKTADPQPAITDAAPEAPERARVGRKATITREALLEAALAIAGPDRGLSSLTLREVAREAGIAPNSFYRHFHDTNELAVALIEQAGDSLRRIIREARVRAVSERSVVRTSLEAFMEPIAENDQLLKLFLREGSVGSPELRTAVERQLVFFEDELESDLRRFAELRNHRLEEPHLAARATTRIVFAMATRSLDLAPSERAKLVDETIVMLRMVLLGARAFRSQHGQPG
ncbi:MAG: HTH-type transcriptional repressor FabR [Deltaproteobacteria bacterium]|nr:HTH-type transcriptional repressor FabR [Deltaproteobacteria bacterium]